MHIKNLFLLAYGQQAAVFPSPGKESKFLDDMMLGDVISFSLKKPNPQSTENFQPHTHKLVLTKQCKRTNLPTMTTEK